MKKNKKSKVVHVKSVFPASKEEVFERLQEFDTLRVITKPYISFEPLDGKKDFVWREGATFVFKSRLFGWLPFGTHTINVIQFGLDNGIYTNEVNTYVPTWNHEITLKEVGENQTEYADIVEIYAGWKTVFVYVWAKLFYRHRQRKWIKILKQELT